MGSRDVKDGDMTTVSVTAVAAEMTQEVSRTLIAIAQATPEDRLNWQPLDNGRSMLNQLIECSLANWKWTTILRTRAFFSISKDVWEETANELDTLEKVTARLRKTTADLVDAIRSMPVEQLSETVDTPWGPYSLARCCLHAYWNMAYHEGQLNYIQTLYGDFEEHEPEEE